MTTAPTALAANESDSARRRTEKILESFHEEERFGKAYDLELMRRLWPFFLPHKRLLIGSSLLMVCPPATTPGRIVDLCPAVAFSAAIPTFKVSRRATRANHPRSGMRGPPHGRTASNRSNAKRSTPAV